MHPSLRPQPGAQPAAVRGEELRVINPFANDICATWREAAAEEGHYVPMHERALEELRALAHEGRVVLLSAPRAGHGKTHLLGRVADAMRGEAVVGGLPWQTAEGLTWEASGRGWLVDLARVGQRVNVLQRMCAGVCASLLKKLIQTGRIPSTDPAQALRVLSQDPMQLFQEGGPAKVIGDWFRKHFDQLRRPLAEISSVEGLEEVELWISAMFDYVEQPTTSALASLCLRLKTDPPAQVHRLFKLCVAWKPVVLVADHMDGLYRDAMAGQAVARMTLELAPITGVNLVLSMNQDLWETAFGRNLPSAFEDRLTEYSLALHGMDVAEADALVRLRLRESAVDDTVAANFLQFLDVERFFLGRPLGSVSARGLLRHAAAQWRLFVHSESPSGTTPPGWGGGAPTDQVSLPVFDLDSGTALQRVAESLAPKTGVDIVDLSQTKVQPSSFLSSSGNIVPMTPSAAAAEPESFLNDEDDEPGGGTLPNPLPSASALGAPSAPMAEGSPSSFQRLRTMLSKLKNPGDAPPMSETGGPEMAMPSPVVASAASGGEPPKDAILARFEAVRNEVASGGGAARLDWHVLGDLIRLAGKRFPVVHYDELELPGLLGRSLPRWSTHGVEIVFGLDDFADHRYWKTVSSFMAGRVAELNAVAASTPQPPPELKLVVFKSDYEGPALAALFRDDIIPQGVRNHIDTVHLDGRSVASLYAMRQIIHEAESGRLSSADPTAVLGVLASELDFFWKRVTRSAKQ